MTGDLLINNNDAYTNYGVSMGDKFIDTIEAPLELKPFIENESRLNHGKTVIVSNVKYAAREITLNFHIKATDLSTLQTKKAAFLAVLYAGNLTIKIKDRSEVYHLRYIGKNAAFALSKSGRSCKLSARFSEDNPSNRS